MRPGQPSTHGQDNELERLLSRTEPTISRLLERTLEGRELSVEAGLRLTDAQGPDLHALVMVADEMRRRQVGETVTYVVNRNINFTNVCIKHCTFCAFSRDYREEEGYFLPVEEVVRRAKEAREMGATEVCIQAGLPPKLDGRFYIEICRAIKQELPDIHIHAFSPEEILYGSTRSGIPLPD
ncbi:MAG: radical SAM protein, partial [candidate division NC10 bacterium]